ncbi:IS5 family transposase [Spirosoma sp. BT702]|uniref:IS5 family transposase n=1 Tax=Spirosoma profusum TaxID=2771354 RepID=A0A927AW00_9BACT|nr:IS5 family transposase [Spirosoma profusum]MBD2705463.1 IS5 family transposase [Spirosoma profusum]
MEAIFYLTKNGTIWRDLSEGFPPWQIVYWYFRKWIKNDTWVLIANELTMNHRLKVAKKPLPTVAVIDSQSVKNSPTATKRIGFNGGKLIKDRKLFLIVDTMGHLLWTDVRPANIADGKAGILHWEQAKHLNPLLDDLVLMYADSAFGGHFKEQLETIYDMRVVIPKSPINSKLVIHHWRWIVKRTISWLGNNRRLAKDYERTLLSAQTFIWIAHIRRTIKRV